MLLERDLAAAWEAVRLALDEAGLRTYLFRVVFAKKQWVIDLEVPHQGSWRRSTLRAGRDELLESIDDRRRRDELAAKWRIELDLSRAA